MDMKSERHWASFKWFLSENDLLRSCSADVLLTHVCPLSVHVRSWKREGHFLPLPRSFPPRSWGFTSLFLPTRQRQEALTIWEELDAHTPIKPVSQKWQTHILERQERPEAAVPLYYLSISTPIRANLQVKGQPAALSEANDKSLLRLKR